MFKRYHEKRALKKKLNFNDEKLKKCAYLSQQEIQNEFRIKNFGRFDNEIPALQERYGFNASEAVRFNWVWNAIKSYCSPFNLVLMLICAYNFYTCFSDPSQINLSGYLPPSIVALMIIASGTVVYIQTIKAHFVTKRLIKMVSNRATVIRNVQNCTTINQRDIFTLVKQSQEIDVRELVPGDLIYLSSGDMVPADVRILTSKDFFINQSSLNGESLPTEKHHTTTKHNLLELENICLAGTSVVSGSAICLVLTTGANTYFASISNLLKQKRPLTSFEKGIKRVTFLLIMMILIIAPIIYVAYAGTKGQWVAGISWAVAAVVTIIPEMLPMIVTSNLARGARQMSKSKVVIKNLASIQNLGAIDILCTDKTGTLTNDQIQLVDCLTLDNKADPELLKMLYLNAYTQTGLKNPIDNAIVNYTQENHPQITKCFIEKIDEIPFDFTRRRLTTVIRSEQQTQLICKGAIEEMLDVCTKLYYQGSIIELDEQLKRRILSTSSKLNMDGYRVLGLAYRLFPTSKTNYNITDECDLVFYGYASFLDIPKPSAAKMVRILEKRGVELKILTGDNEQVTRSICQRVALKVKGLITGDELDGLADYELKRAVEKNNIFVKLSPLQKARVIELLKANDHVVGFLGDGINDAPVLRESDVAISVDNATDIAKEASDVILLEKSLDVLEHGIEQGRLTFGNILKYVKITIASQFGNVFTTLIAAFWIPFTPMLPVQTLLQNLIYDFSQFAIAFDRVDLDFLQSPQRWKTNGFLPFAMVNGPISSIFDVITFIIFGYGFHVFSMFYSDPAAVHNPLDTDFVGWSQQTKHAVMMFESGWFIEGLITQTVVMQMYRTKRIPFFQSRAAWPVNFTTLAVVAIGFLIPYGANSVFGMIQPPVIYIPMVLGIIVSYCLLAQVSKTFYIRISKTWL